jgi:hypothetical protein
VNPNFDPDDELCRLWQASSPPKSDNEVNKVMELVETRAKAFDRAISHRNIREYVAGGIGAVIFETNLTRAGCALVSAGGLWIAVFMWLMQRSAPGPVPESSGEVYKKALFLQYAVRSSDPPDANSMGLVCAAFHNRLDRGESRIRTCAGIGFDYGGPCLCVWCLAGHPELERVEGDR